MKRNPNAMLPATALTLLDAAHPSGARTRIAQLSAAALSLALLAGCVHSEQIGAVSDSSVIAAGRAGGGVLDRPKPVDGAPLAAGLAPGVGCIADDKRLETLGPTC